MSFVDFTMAIMFEVARKMTRSQLNTTENKVGWNKKSRYSGGFLWLPSWYEINFSTLVVTSYGTYNPQVTTGYSMDILIFQKG